MTTYTFSPAEQQEIIDAYNLGPGDSGLAGDHVNYYSKVAEILSRDAGSGAPDDLPLVQPVRIWFNGAADVNAGIGAFSVLIREYTQNQGVLHFGERFGVFQPTGALSEIQEASNELARSTFNALQNDLLWELFPIEEVAIEDAREIAEVLFDGPFSDTIDSLEQSAAWSGVLLFSSFDQPDVVDGAVDETGRLISTGNSDIADTLDDWRNILYANYSYNEAIFEAGLTGFTEFLLAIQVGLLPKDTLVFGEVCLLSGRCEFGISNFVEDQVAESAFAPVLLYGGVDSLNLLKSGAEGTVSLSQVEVGLDTRLGVEVTSGFRDKARALFGEPGPQNQGINATVHPVSSLVRDAHAGDSLAQKALLGLSPFKVDNGQSVSVSVSDQYWSDRGLMTEARLQTEAFNAGDLIAVVSPVFSDPFQFTDLESGATYQVDNNFLPSFDFRQVIFGSKASEVLTGGDLSDSLYGAAGDDNLDGGAGRDFLSGGMGADNYAVCDGRDRIFDADGQGTVQLNSVVLTGGERLASDIWQSVDGRFRYQLLEMMGSDQLRVIDLNDDSAELIIEQFSDGDLGITLEGAANPLPPIDSAAPSDLTPAGRRDQYFGGPNETVLFEAGLQYDLVQSGGGDDLVFLGPSGPNGLADRALTGFGRDTVMGQSGRDYIRAGIGFDNAANGLSDADMASGGADVDLIWTGVGDDFLYAGEPGDAINASSLAEQGDWLVADEGDDVVFGSIREDFISAGEGADVVFAGGGFDVVLGDGHYDFRVNASPITGPDATSFEHQWTGSAWQTSSIPSALATPGTAFDFATSVLAGDFVLTGTAINTTERVQQETAASDSDTIFGGPGDDWLAGGADSDVVHGDEGDDLIYGDDVIPLPMGAMAGNDQLFGGEGADELYGNDGDDELYGGPGNDMLFGDDPGSGVGNDRLFGEGGVDELHGLDGDDYLDGGAGNDLVLEGGAGNDTIDGGEGNDTLTGGADDDVLIGGPGADTLLGGTEDDRLSAGEGDDQLFGDAGNDVLEGGAGLDQLDGGDGDDVYLANINSSPVDAPDVIVDSSGMDRIEFTEFVYPNRITITSQSGDALVAYSPNDALLITGGAGGNVIEEFIFADGRVFSFNDLATAAKVNRGSTNDITAFNDWYEGDGTNETIDLLAGDDAALMDAGDDQADGGPGNDFLDGGPGIDTLNGQGGDDRIFGGPDADVLSGGLGEDLLAGGDGDDTLDSGDGVDVLRGGDGDDHLIGGAGDDFLQGDGGADTLIGGSGNDTYLFNFQDDPAPGVTPRTEILDDAVGGNTIVFLGGLSAEDITVINDVMTGDLEIQYGYEEQPIRSSIYVPNGAGGLVIRNFQFTDGTALPFIELCTQQPMTCENSFQLFRDRFELSAISIVPDWQSEGVLLAGIDATPQAPDVLFALGLVALIAVRGFLSRR